MGTYYTKCGIQFSKSTNSEVTGYKMDIVNDKCKACVFLLKKNKGYPNYEFSHYECRAGSKPTNHKIEFKGRVDDKCNIYIIAYDFAFLERVKKYASEINGVNGVSYLSDDTSDNRRTLSVDTEKNKIGMNAKRLIYDKFFKIAPSFEGQNMIDLIRKLSKTCAS